MKKVEFEPNLFLIEEFLTPAECDQYILWSEQKGYEEAKVSINGQQVMVKGARNNDRITFIDFDLTAKIWEKFRPFAVNHFGNSEVTGLNEMLRFYRYTPGQRFKKHLDGSYVRNAEEASYFTFMIYLNDDFEGGYTTFDTHAVKPVKGNALVFYHGMRHAGDEVKSGVKYVLRTDVMYKLKK
jgi:prolyl 4-hydroxylase